MTALAASPYEYSFSRSDSERFKLSFTVLNSDGTAFDYSPYRIEYRLLAADGSTVLDLSSATSGVNIAAPLVTVDPAAAVDAGDYTQFCRLVLTATGEEVSLFAGPVTVGVGGFGSTTLSNGAGGSGTGAPKLRLAGAPSFKMKLIPGGAGAALASQAEAEAGTDNAKFVSALRVRQAILSAVAVWTPEMFAGTATARVQAAIDAAYAAGGRVELRQVYNVSAVLMRPGIEVRGIKGGGLTRIDGTATGPLIDFGTYTPAAHGASLRGVSIDGNGAGLSVANSDAQLIDVSGANDVVIDACALTNTIGSGILVRGGLRPIITKNTITDCRAGGILFAPGTFAATQATVTGNVLTRISDHAIVGWLSGHNTVASNTVWGDLVLGCVVNIDKVAKTISWVSGTNFANVLPGQFCIFNGNTEELHVSVKDSNTLLHFDTAMVTASVTGATASFGSADLINFQSGQYNQIYDNKLFDGVGCGVVVWDDNVNFSINNKVSGNVAKGVGSSGFTLQGLNAAKNISNTFADNLSYNCGRNGAAGHPDYNTGMTLSVGDKTFVHGNQAYGDSGTMTYGILVRSSPVGALHAYGNSASGCTNGRAIGNAIASIVPSAGWGSTAAVSATACDGETLTFTLTPGGTGIAASPNIVVNKNIVGRQAQIVQMQDAFTGNVVDGYVISNSDVAMQFQLSGFTPTSGRAYAFRVQL
jgi:hypothetical protein